jgi:cysteine-rich repeat protein
VSGDGCNTSCQLEVCGNGRIDYADECEPPNSIACSATCQKVARGCGNGVLDPGEQCEDGNQVNGDGCSSFCLLEFCGDGTVNAPEQCEPPNTATCDASCRFVSAAAAP